MTWDHELKIWPPHFDHVLENRRRFDVRANDRRFKVGDVIKLREWTPNDALDPVGGGAYTGRNMLRRVRYVLNPMPDRDPDMGLVAGYVVLDLEPVEREEKPNAVRPKQETEHAA